MEATTVKVGNKGIHYIGIPIRDCMSMFLKKKQVVTPVPEKH